MELQFLTGINVLKSSVYSNMSILKDFSLRDHAVLVKNLKDSGYEEVFKNYDYQFSTGVYKKDGEIVTLHRNAQQNEMRVMWEEEKYNSTEPLAKPTEVFDGETVMSQIGVGAYGVFDDDPMIGMLYIYKLSNGHAIIIDGGVPTQNNADDIYKALQSHGVSADENGKYIIDAWIFSHAHGDHIGTFNVFAESYADKVTVGYFLYNFPGDGKLVNIEWNSPVFEENINKFPEAKRIVPR